MACLDEQGRAQLAGVNDALHLGIAAVIAAHEAHLYQALADLQLAGNDLLAVRRVLAQRLFTEAPLLVFEHLHHIVMMGGVDGGDDHCFHLGIRDQAIAVAAEGADAVLGGQIVRTPGGIGGHGHHSGAGDLLDDAAAVILADSAAADQANFQNLIQCYLLLKTFWQSPHGLPYPGKLPHSGDSR